MPAKTKAKKSHKKRGTIRGKIGGNEGGNEGVCVELLLVGKESRCESVEGPTVNFFRQDSKGHDLSLEVFLSTNYSRSL